MADNNSITLGKYIERVRLEKKITKRDLALICGISSAELTRIESGKREEPSPTLLKKIAKSLGVNYIIMFTKIGYIDSLDTKYLGSIDEYETQKDIIAEIKNCHARSSHCLDHLGDRNIPNVNSYDVAEIIHDLQKLDSLVIKYKEKGYK